MIDSSSALTVGQQWRSWAPCPSVGAQAPPASGCDNRRGRAPIPSSGFLGTMVSWGTRWRMHLSSWPQGWMAAILPVSLSSAKTYMRRTLVDPPPEHARTREVYVTRPPVPSTRKEAVILAQLRRGLSPVTQSSLHRIGVAQTPMFPRCNVAEEDLKHFLQDYPATLGL